MRICMNEEFKQKLINIKTLEAAHECVIKPYYSETDLSKYVGMLKNNKINFKETIDEYALKFSELINKTSACTRNRCRCVNEKFLNTL